MPDRRRLAIVVTPLLALLAVAAAILWPSAASAQSAEPAVVCFEITVGWRICAAPAVAPIAAVSPLPSTTLSYGAPTTTGSVTDDGDYAFLTDSDDLTTLVTTYEGLRDGSTAGLVIHKNDSAGASQEAFYDLVQAGDIVEWRQASDCFVRYPVTEVKDDPAGDPPRKLLAVKVMTYAFTGCSGAIDTTESPAITWAPANLRSPDMTIPIRHGPWQLRPNSWTGAIEPRVVADGWEEERERIRDLDGSTDPAVVRQHRLWRELTLPEGWRISFAYTGIESADGVIAEYVDAEGRLAVAVGVSDGESNTGGRWARLTYDHEILTIQRDSLGPPALRRRAPAPSPGVIREATASSRID